MDMPESDGAATSRATSPEHAYAPMRSALLLESLGMKLSPTPTRRSNPFCFSNLPSKRQMQPLCPSHPFLAVLKVATVAVEYGPSYGQQSEQLDYSGSSRFVAVSPCFTATTQKSQQRSSSPPRLAHCVLQGGAEKRCGLAPKAAFLELDRASPLRSVRWSQQQARPCTAALRCSLSDSSLSHRGCGIGPD